MSEPFNLGRNLREDLALNISSETEKPMTYGSDRMLPPVLSSRAQADVLNINFPTNLTKINVLEKW